MTAFSRAAAAAAYTGAPGDEASLRERLAEVTAERDALAAQLVAAEEHGANLVKLYVANRRLNEAVGRQDVLEAIHEIVISVVGCEEFAVVERNSSPTGPASLASSFGIELATMHVRPEASPPVLAVLDSGVAHFAAPGARTTSGADGDGLTACVPLTAGSGRVVGAIALYGLLPHRGDLDQHDRTLLELIGLEAGRALSGRAASAA